MLMPLLPVRKISVQVIGNWGFIKIQIRAGKSNSISVEGSAAHKEFESIQRQQAPYEAECC